MKKRIFCVILAVLLLGGIVTTGLFTDKPGNADKETESRRVSDYFYIQIYDTNDQVVSKYKVTLSGAVSAGTREITGVSFNLESGDACETIQKIDGDMAGIVITHPTEGYLMRVFVLDENGVFVEY